MPRMAKALKIKLFSAEARFDFMFCLGALATQR